MSFRERYFADDFEWMLTRTVRSHFPEHSYVCFLTMPTVVYDNELDDSREIMNKRLQEFKNDFGIALDSFILEYNEIKQNGRYPNSAVSITVGTEEKDGVKGFRLDTFKFSSESTIKEMEEIKTYYNQYHAAPVKRTRDKTILERLQSMILPAVGTAICAGLIWGIMYLMNNTTSFILEMLSMFAGAFGLIPLGIITFFLAVATIGAFLESDVEETFVDMELKRQGYEKLKLILNDSTDEYTLLMKKLNLFKEWAPYAH